MEQLQPIHPCFTADCFLRIQNTEPSISQHARQTGIFMNCHAHDILNDRPAKTLLPFCQREFFRQIKNKVFLQPLPTHDEQTKFWLVLCCRPLFVQFCANNPSTLLQAAKLVQDYCDAVDINLGCPQRIARKGKYGAFLMENMDIIESLVTTLAQACFAKLHGWCWTHMLCCCALQHH